MYSAQSAAMSHLLQKAVQALLAESSKRPRRSLALIAGKNYLDWTPEAYIKRCDVLLKLDDGSELPAHAEFLARFSKVCASMMLEVTTW